MSTIPVALNHSDLANLLAARTGLTQKEAHEVIRELADIIASTVTAGQDVAITNFGTWLSRESAERKARNPHTGGQVIVPAHRKVRFRISPRLAEIVRGGDPTASTRKHPSR